MPTIVLAGTLDTKGHEYGFLRDRVREQGADVLLVDVGVYAPQIEPDVSREEVARAAGEDADALADTGDRGAATEAMGRGAAALLTRLHDEGRLDGVLGIGGSGGSSIVTTAMRALPVGVPKLMVSTLASGDTRPYVGAVDVTMMYSVVDIAGINSISARILTNAAGAIAGMVRATVPSLDHKPPAPATPKQHLALGSRRPPRGRPRAGRRRPWRRRLLVRGRSPHDARRRRPATGETAPRPRRPGRSTGPAVCLGSPASARRR